MEVICLQDEAFYALIDKVVTQLKEKNNITHDKWISGEEAMSMLRITSKTTLQKLRDTGAIRFSQPEKKIILYDVESIHTYLEKHAKDTF
ncbi:helix-turn-helix domain-containing protein [Sphingobacterium siyangense]|uniref:helix-turn-helix domain-containing protein n=1 Tax=Sphingobacterium siyangense TaxID=459529 RepID=UPI003DA58256